jgi:hypothetical protein
MTLLGVCITKSFLMYDLEYMRSQSTGISYNSNSKSSSRSSNNEIDREEKLDFTNFLNKLAYQMIFNDIDISSIVHRHNKRKKGRRRELNKLKTNSVCTNCYRTHLTFEEIARFAVAKLVTSVVAVQT